jgi:gamma-glutamyl-gamma-aminobutyraldehyde dehydrogenase
MGVIGAVLPWNFPAAMLAWKLAPALAAGNSVVVKPPELACLSTIRIAELAVEAGLPEGVFNVVPGPGEIAGRAVGLHPDVDCADQLDIVAEDLAQAAFWNSGQNCSAGSRILADAAIKDELVARLAERAGQLVVGDPADESTTLGPLIEAEAMDRILRYVSGAAADGGRIVVGGRRVLKETGGWYVGPTVLDNVTPQMAVAREEIFGPVVSVLSYADAAEALDIANQTDYGLAATVWSRDIDAAVRMARGIRAGTVAINGYSEGDISTPFGGYKMSGFGGRDNGLEALEQYTQLKTIWLTIR